MAGALRTILAKFGFDIDEKKLTSAKSRTDQFASSVKTLADKFAGGDLGGAIKDMIADLGDQASELRRVSNQLGIAIPDLQRWQGAAKLAGIENATLTAGFRLLQKNAAAAAGVANDAATSFEASADGSLESALGNKAAGEAFKALGVEVRDAAGEIKPVTQLMGDVGLAIGDIKNPSERTAIAMKIFGRQGAALIPLFNKGEKGLQEYLDRIDDLGGGLSEDALDALKKNSRASKEFTLSTLSLKSAIVANLLPALTEKTKLLTTVLAWVNRTQKGTQILKSAILLLGAAILYTQRQAIVAGIKTAIAWAPTILAFAALALIVDDVWTAFKGGDSVLGRFVDKLFGVGTSKKAFSGISQSVDQLSKDLDNTPDFGDKAEIMFLRAGSAIGKFGSDLAEALGYLWADISALPGKFNDWLTQSLLSVIHGIADWTKKAAAAITDGIANGLRDGWDKVKETFTELFTSLEKDFKKFFKINSPSVRMGDLTEFIPMGVVNKLAEWTPKVKSQAEETFAPIASLAPGSGTFAPVIRLPSTPRSGSSEPVSKRVDMRNTIENHFHGVGAGVRDAARDGIGLAFDDERRAMLAALESEL